MQPAREARGAQIAFRRGTLVWSDAAPRDGLQLERDEAEHVVVIDVEVARDREAAADRAAGTLVRPAAERQAPALHACVDRAVGIEPIRFRSEQALIAVRRGHVEDDERILRDLAARNRG